ncbi:MAG: response regulator transcription factor [Flavobacteriales bacterium]|nr:response regulator transcription factor [Flavobacteriales bacterium]
MIVRTLLADHSELSLLGLRTLLGGVPRVQLVGEARSREELEERLVGTRPDVVLIDHTAEGFDASAIRQGMRLSRRTRFIAFTPFPSEMALKSALRAGVTSYIKKDCGLDEIVEAVLDTADGSRFFCGKILAAIGRENIARLSDVDLDCQPVTLSEREHEIVTLIAEGLSYTRIAERLNLSAHTVNTHRRNVMQKLGVNNTASLVMYAVKQGLVSPNRFLFNG